MRARVDLCDPSSDGPWILEQLWQEGFEVRRIGLDDVPRTEADLVLIAGDASGALRALRHLRDDEARGDVPVVLLGAPDGFEHRGTGPALGADAVFARPVALEALLARTRELLADLREAPEVSSVSAPVERTMRLPDEGSEHTSERPARSSSRTHDPASSQVLSVGETVKPASWRPREPTIQLDEIAEPSEVVEQSFVSRPRREGTSPGRRRRTGSGVGTPATGSITGADAPQPVIPPDERAQLSPWLVALLAAADRRVFPDRPALEIHFPAADESPEELVPAELLEVSIRVDEPMIEDPIDAFTYVGGPAVPPPSPATGAESAPPTTGRASPEAEETSRPGTTSGGRRSEHTTATELPLLEPDTPGSGVHLASAFPSTDEALPGASWPEEDSVLGPASLDGVRRGALGPGGALRLLFRVASLQLDASCELEADTLSLRFTFLRGELRGFDGPIARTAARGLARRGRLAPTPQTEPAAQAALEAAVEAGTLGRFERDRLLREARDALLVQAVASERAEFTLRHLDDTEPGRALARRHVLARPLRAALVDAARLGLSGARVASMIGVESLDDVATRLGPAREAGLGPTQLPGEIVDLLVRHEGHSVRALSEAAPSEPGLPGLVYALFAADLLVPERRVTQSTQRTRSAVRDLVERAAARALDGDYFAILGLDVGASARAVSSAFTARRSELACLDLDALGLLDLEDARASALDAIEEAEAILTDPRLRAPYTAAWDHLASREPRQ